MLFMFAAKTNVGRKIFSTGLCYSVCDIAANVHLLARESNLKSLLHSLRAFLHITDEQIS